MRPCAVAALFWLALPAFPAAVSAQQSASKETESAAPADKLVSLDVEETSLLSAIKLLMKSAQADYTIDNALRGAIVTAHLTNMRLRAALDTLLKASSLPAAYRYEDGIYNFIPRVETLETTLPAEPGPEAPAETSEPHLAIIKVNFVDPALIARLLGGTVIQSMGQSYGLVNFVGLSGFFGFNTSDSLYNGYGQPFGNSGYPGSFQSQSGSGSVLIEGPTDLPGNGGVPNNGPQR
jgi:hypothetical protein